jgi:hypothetical protein
MRNSETYFEQIPVQTVKDLVKTEEDKTQTSRGQQTPLRCSICRKPVPIETAKTDSDGLAVHGECYLRSVTKTPIVARTRRTQLLS